MRDIKIGTVICRSRAGEIEENLSKMRRWIQVAGDENVEILCFPELNITGYAISDLAAEIAEPVFGRISESVVSAARDYDMIVLAGLLEKGDSNRIYATHLVAGPTGVIGVYRKTHIAPPEYNRLTPGNAVPVFKARDVTFGVQLCYDAHFPELSSIMAAQGAEILFIPHASPRGTPEQKYRSWMRHLPARAYDNGVFVVVCNQTGQNGQGLTFPGLSIIIDPSGYETASRLSDDEILTVVDLEEKALSHVRRSPMRYFFPNRRPDIYAAFRK